MDEPSEQEDPEDAGEDEEENRRKESSLEQLSESGDEETRQRGDDIACGALAVGHGEVLCGTLSDSKQKVEIPEKKGISRASATASRNGLYAIKSAFP
jgi:hypothetical protein